VAGSMAVIVAPAGSASDLPNAGRDAAAGTFVAFGRATAGAPAGAAVRLVAGGELDLPPVGPPWTEVALVARVKSNRASARSGRPGTAGRGSGDRPARTSPWQGREPTELGRRGVHNWGARRPGVPSTRQNLHPAGHRPGPACGQGRGRTTLQHCNGPWYLPAMRRSPRWNAFPRFVQARGPSWATYRVTHSGHTKELTAAWTSTI
jgi:hypothetical protein